MSTSIKGLSVALLLTLVIPAQGMFRAGLMAARTAARSFARPPMAKMVNFQRPVKSLLKSPFGRLGTLAVAAGAAQVAAHRVEGYNEYPQHRYAAGKLTVKNFKGTINVEGWEKPTITIKTTKEDPFWNDQYDAMSRTQIATGSNFEKTYAKTLISDDANELTSKYRRPWPNGRKIAHVHYDIKAPFNTDLSLVSEDGDISVKDIKGDMKVRTEGSASKINVENYQGRSINLVANGYDGTISATNVSGQLYAQSFNGDITIKGSDNGISEVQGIAQSHAGNINLKNADKVVTQINYPARINYPDRGKVTRESK